MGHYTTPALIRPGLCEVRTWQVRSELVGTALSSGGSTLGNGASERLAMEHVASESIICAHGGV